MGMNSDDLAAVPDAITLYQASHDNRDVETALAQFTDDAHIEDDGRTYGGRSGVESFLQRAGSEYTYTRTLIGVSEVSPDCWRITNRLEGNFPGGIVDLSYEFVLKDRLIATLTIAP
jgi:hypothetical protein